MKALLLALLIPSLQAGTFSTWTLDEFEPDEMAISAPDADPDQDGMPNLLEYALGTDPLFPDASEGHPTITFLDGKIQLEYKRDIGKSDIKLVMQVSSDLKTWMTAPSELLSSKRGVEKRRVTLSLRTRAFFRLRVAR